MARFEDALLQGDGFVLRTPRVDDAEGLAACWADDLTQRWLPVPGHASLAAAQDYVEAVVPRRRVLGGLELVVEREGRASGVVGLSPAPRSSATHQLSCMVAPWTRRCGVGNGAMRLLSAWALRSQGVVRVEAHVAVGNEPSARCAAAAGFQLEGVMRKGGRVAGQPVDMELFSLVLDDLDDQP